MTELSTYLMDGANYQARAILMCLQINSDIESSWNEEYKTYDATIQVARWENCREQGYIVSLRSKDYSKQLNIAFFEHRNSDNICAIKWEQLSMNSITIDNAQFGDVYKGKWGVSHSLGYGKYLEMSVWIMNELETFWNTNKK